MASQRQIDADLMAKALAELILFHKEDVDSLLASYGIDSVDFSPQERLLYVERMIQTNKQFANQVVNLIGAKGGEYRGFIDSIINAVGGVTSGIAGIIDATSDSGKKVRETQAQAALTAAQAQLESARAQQQIAARRKQTTVATIGIVSVALVATVGIFAFFKFRKK